MLQASKRRDGKNPVRRRPCPILRSVHVPLRTLSGAFYIAVPQQPPPAPQAWAPGQAAPLEHAGPLEIRPIAMPPTRDINFSVSFELHAGQGRVLFVNEDTISSNTFPHFLHSYS